MNIQMLIQSPEFKQKFVLEKLLSHYLDKTREELWLDAQQELPTPLLDQIIADYKAYTEEKKPLEYILWFVEFFGVRFKVNEHTLIPRPETEYMISSVTEHLAEADQKDAILLDIGTWSGVLWCSILLQNADRFREVFFSDISEEALLVAKKNYDKLIDGMRYDSRFILSDLCAFLESYPSVISNKNLILVANLPYIPDATFDDNAPDTVQKWEPRLAFVGGDDGLNYYRTMFAQLTALREVYAGVTMFLEMMTWQVEILRKEFGDMLVFEEVKTFHFNIRIVKAWFK